MQSSLEYLRKLFRLEHANHYNNTAVIGGLANILSYWEGDARNEHVPEPLIQAVAATLNGYSAQVPEVRIESLKALWRRIQEVYPEAIPARRPVPPPPAPRPAPEPIAQQPPPEPPMAVAEPITQSLPAEAPSAPLETLPAEAPPEPEPPAALPPVQPEAASPQPPEPQPASVQDETRSKDPAETQPVTVPFSSPRPAAPPPAAPTPAAQPVHTQPRPMPGRADSRPGGVTSKRPIALNASLTVLAGVGPQARRHAHPPGSQHPGRHALLLPAPLRRLQPAQAHPGRLLRRASHRDRRGHHGQLAPAPRRKDDRSPKSSSATAPAVCA